MNSEHSILSQKEEINQAQIFEHVIDDVENRRKEIEKLINEDDLNLEKKKLKNMMEKESNFEPYVLYYLKKKLLF